MVLEQFLLLERDRALVGILANLMGQVPGMDKMITNGLNNKKYEKFISIYIYEGILSLHQCV